MTDGGGGRLLSGRGVEDGMRSLRVLKRRIVERGSGRLKVAAVKTPVRLGVNDALAQLLSWLPNSNILANVSKLIRLKNAIHSA